MITLKVGPPSGTHLFCLRIVGGFFYPLWEQSLFVLTGEQWKHDHQQDCKVSESRETACQAVWCHLLLSHTSYTLVVMPLPLTTCPPPTDWWWEASLLACACSHQPCTLAASCTHHCSSTSATATAFPPVECTFLWWTAQLGLDCKNLHMLGN